MKKLAIGNGKVYCEMSLAEFNGLARGIVTKDGEEMSLAWIKAMATLVDGKKDELIAIAAKSSDLATAIKSVVK